MSRFGFWTIVLILTWLLLAVLLFVPVGSVLVSSLYDNAGNFTLGNYLKAIGDERIQRAFVNTLLVGFGGLAGR